MIPDPRFLSPSEGAEVLEKGGVLVFPTETVYGLGALATDRVAFQRIYQIKGRPSDNPLILHYAHLDSIREDTVLSDRAELVLRKFSPGPLTLILTKKNKALLPESLSTVGVRIPNHTECQKMLTLLGKPVAAPSANLSGKPSITDKFTAVQVLNGMVDGFLEGGEPTIGMESTVIDFTRETPVLLRWGGIPWEELKAMLPDLQTFESNHLGDKSSRVPKSPGMKYRHYAPNGRVKVLAFGEGKPLESGEAYLGTRLQTQKSDGVYQVKISCNREYLYYLYRFLNECDRRNIQSIFLENPASDEFSETILDRLEKIVSADTLE